MLAVAKQYIQQACLVLRLHCLKRFEACHACCSCISMHSDTSTFVDLLPCMQGDADGRNMPRAVAG